MWFWCFVQSMPLWGIIWEVMICRTLLSCWIICIITVYGVMRFCYMIITEICCESWRHPQCLSLGDTQTGVKWPSSAIDQQEHCKQEIYSSVRDSYSSSTHNGDCLTPWLSRVSGHMMLDFMFEGVFFQAQELWVWSKELWHHETTFSPPPCQHLEIRYFGRQREAFMN